MAHSKDSPMTYVRSIRNPVKREYAQAVWHALANQQAVPARPADLSCMAAQAVVMRLRPFTVAAMIMAERYGSERA